MKYLLLQTNELAQDAWWIAGTVVVLLLAALYMRKILADREKRKEILHDPRSHAVNDSNYNISREGMDGHRTEEMNQEEALKVVNGLKDTGEIPTQEEFDKLRKGLKK